MRKLYGLLFIIIILTFSVEGTLYKNDKRSYNIEYPDDWNKNEQIQGFDLFIMAPNNDAGQSLANMSIISGEIPQSVDLNIYTEENLKNLQKNPHVKMKEQGTTTINEIPVKWARYTRDDDQTEIIHYFFVKDGIGYLITGGAHKDVYDQYADQFDTVAKSFKKN